MIHDFHESLAVSHAAEDLPFWEEAYREAFPAMVAMINHREDGDHQRQGIDRSVILANSKQILIDEKVRYKNRTTGKVYEDILLEFLSDYDRNVPGWVCKPLLCDYIAYAIAPLGKCYLLPVMQLQEAWRRKSEEWKAKYRLVTADNRAGGRCWQTHSIGVSVADVFGAIGACLRVSFAPYEENNNL